MPTIRRPVERGPALLVSRIHVGPCHIECKMYLGCDVYLGNNRCKNGGRPVARQRLRRHTQARTRAHKGHGGAWRQIVNGRRA
jgi:hypothetical protein